MEWAVFLRSAQRRRAGREQPKPLISLWVTRPTTRYIITHSGLPTHAWAHWTYPGHSQEVLIDG
jgi:hypothetical protein